ncbi:MAG: hypothetical protein ABSA12_12630 [Verrucomicrobiia bacterium]
MQDWLELDKGCSIAPRAKRQVIRIEVECDHAMYYVALNEIQTVAARDAKNGQRARLKLSNGSL